MFIIGNDRKFFIKPEYAVIQNSAMTHRYKWAIADVLFGKNISSTVGSSYNELWRGNGILFDLIMIQKG